MQKYGTLLAPVLDASCEAQRGDGLPPAGMAGSSAGGAILQCRSRADYTTFILFTNASRHQQARAARTEMAGETNGRLCSVETPLPRRARSASGWA
jgi:hypothetical protein